MAMNTLARNGKGYTLIELMMAVAIIGIMFSVAPAMLLQGTRFFRQNSARIEIQREARDSMDLISRSLRQAKADTVVVDQLSGEPPYSRITFSRPDSGDGTDTVSFYRKGKSLFMTRGGTKEISRDIRYLGFTYPSTGDKSIISISLTMEIGTYENRTKALQLSVERVRLMND